MRRRNLILRYVTTGLLASAIDLLILFIFKEFLDLWYLESAVIALAFSFTFAFFMQKYWTFSDYSHIDLHGQFFRYFFTAIFSIILNLTILSLLVEFFSINYIVAQAISLFIGGVVGFVMNIRNVFQRVGDDNGIVIAAGIFPPDIGGPAPHIHRLAKELTARDIKVSVITYLSSKKLNDNEGFDVTRIPSNWPIFLRGPAYIAALFISAVGHFNIFAQDVTSTGLPAMIVKKILPHKHFVIRIGGDLLWERKVESGATKLPMIDYYASGAYKTERLFKIGRSVMFSADKIIVPAEFLKEIYMRFYDIPADKISVIKNPIPDISTWKLSFPLETKFPSTEKTVLFAGRFIKLKNLDRLIQAFAAVYEEIKPARLVLIGDGSERKDLEARTKMQKMDQHISIINTLSRDQLFSHIKTADLCVCPSLSEVNSNFSLECLALGKPVLLTRNNGLSIKLPNEMLFSPDDQRELQDKIKTLLSGRYDSSKLADLVQDGSAKNSWQNVVDEYAKIFNV